MCEAGGEGWSEHMVIEGISATGQKSNEVSSKDGNLLLSWVIFYLVWGQFLFFKYSYISCIMPQKQAAYMDKPDCYVDLEFIYDLGDLRKNKLIQN